MNEDLKLPNTHSNAGIDHVNVMEFLNLKRVNPINSDPKEKHP